MFIVYIAHPVGGDVEENLKKIIQIVRQINLEEFASVPFAPYVADCYALNDNIPKEREKGIENTITLMKKGFIDEIRLYGNRISKGMRWEIELARKLGIRVVPMTKNTKEEYEKQWE